jgi:hypothetical protein
LGNPTGNHWKVLGEINTFTHRKAFDSFKPVSVRRCHDLCSFGGKILWSIADQLLWLVPLVWLGSRFSSTSTLFTRQIQPKAAQFSTTHSLSQN